MSVILADLEMNAPITAERMRALDLASIPDFVLGDLTVKPATREVCRNGEAEILEPRVMQVLVALAEEQGQVVSRERLIERCWGGRIVSEDAINTSMAKVRKIGEAHGAFAIQTVPRVGYRLIVSGAPAPDAPAKQARLWRITALVLLLLVLAIATAAAVLVGKTGGPTRPLQVALQPFQAEPNSPAAAAFAQRMDDVLTGSLTERHIDVAPSGKNAPLLVRGAIEVHGEAARARVTLVDRRGPLVIWQGQFEGPHGFDSTLPEQVATKLNAMLYTWRSVHDSNHGASLRPEAMKAYVLGMESYRERHNLIEHLAFMRSMREMAPKVPVVQATYAMALVEAATDQPAEVGKAWRAEALTEATAAVRGDPKLGLAYSAQSNAMDPHDFAGRMAVLRRGLKNAPLDGPLNAHASLFMAQMGRPMEGLPYSRRGHSIDPDAAPRAYHNANYLIAVGLVDEGRDEMAKVRRLWPTNGRNSDYLTLMALETMGPAEGAALIKEVQAQFPGAIPAALWLDFFDAMDGGRHRAETAARIRAAALAHETPASFAVIALTRLGQLDQAFEVARLVKLDGMLAEYRLLFAPETAPLRRQPRFMDLAAELGLAQYWKTSGEWPEFCAEPGLPYDCRTEAARALTRSGKT